MAFVTKTISIQALQPAHGGCSGCLPTATQTPVCRATVGEACAAPQLSGPADQVSRLMAALAPLLTAGCGGGTGRVHALQVQPGEVALQLAVGPHCAGSELADQAFQTLRGLLPDTDIYVNLAA